LRTTCGAPFVLRSRETTQPWESFSFSVSLRLRCLLVQ